MQKKLLHYLNNVSFIEWIATGIIFLLFFIRFYFYLLQLKLLKQIRQSDKVNFIVPVSVIIAAKNEAKNLKRFLPSILQQNYPEFEVIVVNDGSNDNTEEILSHFKTKYSNLKTTFIKGDPHFKHNKKLAISIGIKAAKYENFVFTDADCYVQSNQWLTQMARNFKENNLVLGFGGYEKENTLLNKLIRYDTLKIAILYFSKALSGKPYMGVGRNLAYTKSLYNQVKGFSSHYHVPTGDDDLFVREASSYAKTAIETDPKSFTMSVPPSSFKAWQQQKSRHLQSSQFYSFGQNVFLGLEGFSRSTFHLFAVAGIILFPKVFFLVLLFFLVDLVIKLILSKKLFRHFGSKDLIFFEFFFDILVPFLVFVRLIMNIFTRQNNIWT